MKFGIQMIHLLAVLGTLAFCVHGAPVADPNYTAQIAQADAYLNALQSERVIGGIAAVQKEGKIVYAKGYGFAIEEFDIPLDPDQTIHIGSNSKLFTAVAIYQLQEQGLLDVNEPVNPYITPEAYGLNGTWCPLIYGREDEGCQEPTFKNMMEMSSGALPVTNMQCGDGKGPWTEDDWYWQYGLLGIEGPYGFFSGDASNVLDGTFSPKDALNFENWFNLPFKNAPGEAYCYVNNNFVTLGAIVESLTNMTLVDYITQNIIEPANLTSTYVWNGARGGMPTGIRKNDILTPGYVATFDNSTGGLPKFSVVNRLPAYMPSQIPLTTQATGDMVSSVGDIIRWYSILTGSPETVGLTREAVEYMTTPWNKIPVNLGNAGDEAYFGQGIGIIISANNASRLTYTGDIWNTATTITFWENAEDATKGDAVAFFSNYAVAIPPQNDGSCAIATRNGTTMNLDPSLCSGNADYNKVISNALADIFDVSSTVAGDNEIAPSPDFILPTLTQASG